MDRILIFTLIIVFLFIYTPRQVTAQVSQVLSVTATVPVSDVWLEAVANNSQIYVDIGQNKKNKESSLSIIVVIRGPGLEKLENRRIKSDIFLNGKFFSSVVNDGIFSLPIREKGDYHFIFTDITWDRQIKLKEDIGVLANEGSLQLDQPRTNILSALKTFFLSTKMYITNSAKNINRIAFLTGKQIK